MRLFDFEDSCVYNFIVILCGYCSNYIVSSIHTQFFQSHTNGETIHCKSLKLYEILQTRLFYNKTI